MTRPDDAPDASAEPGHRARAYAAALLGELTGGRRLGAERDPQDPAAVPDLAASTLLADDAPQDRVGDPPTTSEGADAGEGIPDTGTSAPADEAPQPQAAEEPLLGDTADLDAGTGASLAGGSPAVEKEPALATATAPAPADALVGTPVRADAAVDRVAPAPGTRGPRPSPFTYAEVAAHHTGPARSRAGAVLDTVGAHFSSSADREQVRRAARSAVEAAALLDACDALDARAAAVDATWNGERHGATEVREFEGAWGGFYDTSAALSA